MRATARSALVRAFRILAGLVAFAAVAGMTAWGATAGKQYLHTSPTFAVDRITFEGTRRAVEAELLRLGGLNLGENIFDADLVEAERGMAAHPWVRRVSIGRDYPRGLTVRVIEHTPVALAELGGLYYVDEEGQAFKKLSPGEEADLPIFVGFTREEYAAREAEIQGLFRSALEAVSSYAQAGLEKRAPVSEVRIDPLEGLTFFVGKEAVAVKLGEGEYQDKFSRLDVLLTELSRRGARAEVIRLDNRARPGWVAVQLANGVGEAKQQ